MNKTEIVAVLNRNGFKLRLDEGVIFGATKGKITIMVSMLGSNTTISVKFKGKTNKQKSIELMEKLFPTAIYTEVVGPVTASYFTLQKIH